MSPMSNLIVILALLALRRLPKRQMRHPEKRLPAQRDLKNQRSNSAPKDPAVAHISRRHFF